MMRGCLIIHVCMFLSWQLKLCIYVGMKASSAGWVGWGMAYTNLYLGLVNSGIIVPNSLHF